MSEPISAARLEMIRKLLAKAESPACTEAERDSINEKVTELIAKYGVETAELYAKGEIRENVIGKHFLVDGNYKMDKKVLMGVLVDALGIKGVVIQQGWKGEYGIPGKPIAYLFHVFAFESDMQRLEILYNSLSLQMLLGAAAARPPAWSRENLRSYRKSWMTGFAHAIGQRLRRAQKRATEEAAPGTDLVLFDRSKLVEAACDTEYPKVSKAVVKRTGRGSGAAAGYDAGMRASLSETQIGGLRVAVGR